MVCEVAWFAGNAEKITSKIVAASEESFADSAGWVFQLKTSSQKKPGKREAGLTETASVRGIPHEQQEQKLSVIRPDTCQDKKHYKDNDLIL